MSKQVDDDRELLRLLLIADLRREFKPLNKEINKLLRQLDELRERRAEAC